jgi:serine/threonine protein kinase
LERALSGKLVVKVGYLADDFCDEKAALAVLDGLDCFAPKTFPVIAGVPPRCLSRTIVMDRISGSTWLEAVTAFDSDFYVRFSRIISAVRALHEKGFLHSDLKPSNIIVRREDPSFVKLIDFGLASPYLDASTGKHRPLLSRKDDMVGLVSLVLKTNEIMPAWFQEFKDDIAVLGQQERPNYEKWISFFTSEI